MSKFRIGIIGCGGRMWSHLEAFKSMPDVEVVAVADPVEERREKYAQLTGAERKYFSHKEFYAAESSSTLDAIFIAIEPTAHIGTEEPAVEMGIPFLVEKPMTLDLEQGRRLAKAIEQKGLITAVGFQDRYLDLMEAVKAELPKHRAGGLVFGSWTGGIPGVWWWQKKSTCGGQLVEQNIHLLDGLRWLYGEPLSVYATSTTGIVTPGVDASEEYDTDDHSTAVLRFKNGVTATLVSGCYCKNGICPSNGFHIVLNDMIIDYHLRNNLIFETAHEKRDIKRAHNQNLSLDRAFVDAVKNNNPSLVRSPYGDALKTLELGFACNKAMETGEVIYFNK